jgi:hypothetical protein
MAELGPGRAAGLAIVGAVLVLPLCGAWLAHSNETAEAGRRLAELFEFPPRLRIPAGYRQFSWIAAGLVLLPFAAIAASWILAATRNSRQGSSQGGAQSVNDIPLVPQRGSDRTLPWWGWAALGWTIAVWVLAWTRFPWFAAGQRYTFFPLWLGFIVSVNALTWRRTGTCLMQRAPRQWLGLFALSAAFWWGFEWLNRFVRNWHYLSVEDFGPAAYAVHATLCFSTVLPAVSAVREWLGADLRREARGATGPAWPWLARRRTGAVLILGGLGALVLTGAYPQQFFPALWAAPLALVLGEGILAGRPGVGREIAAGDWRRAATWAMAALVCGFFWEMWNSHSAAKWIYTVPFVDRWHVFEMPLLGYLGYLPFGLECLLVMERVFGPTGLGTEQGAFSARGAA